MSIRYYFLLVLCIQISSAFASLSSHDKKEMMEGAYDGCMKKQTSDPASKQIKQSAIQAVCKCVASDMVQSLSNDVDFQRAWSAKNEGEVSRILYREVTPPKETNRRKHCLSDAFRQHGGVTGTMR